MTEALEFAPDLILIHTGHNEFFGAYGVNSISQGGAGIRQPQSVLGDGGQRAGCCLHGFRCEHSQAPCACDGAFVRAAGSAGNQTT